jgi:hypothetical protein
VHPPLHFAQQARNPNLFDQEVKPRGIAFFSQAMLAIRIENRVGYLRNGLRRDNNRQRPSQLRCLPLFPADQHSEADLTALSNGQERQVLRPVVNRVFRATAQGDVEFPRQIGVIALVEK